MARAERQSPGAVWLAMAGALAEALEAENRALLALDLSAVAATLAAKQQAMAAATGVAGNIKALAPHEQPAARALGARLVAAADENRRLLERAMAVQRRVIALVVKAAQASGPSATSRAPRYGVGGTMLAGNAGPMALSARA